MGDLRIELQAPVLTLVTLFTTGASTTISVLICATVGQASESMTALA